MEERGKRRNDISIDHKANKDQATKTKLRYKPLLHKSRTLDYERNL